VLPLRAKLTLVFAMAMAVVFAALGWFTQLRVRDDIDAGVHQALHARAGALSGSVREHWPTRRGLIQPGERYAQVFLADGRLVATRPEADGHLLRPSEVSDHLHWTGFIERPEHTRLLAQPVTTGGQRLVIVVASSLAQRESAVEGVGGALVIGGALALALASLSAYGIATAALRPVESMRRRAEQITAAQQRTRLPVPGSRDEIGRLADTLNAMLGRLADAAEHERSFVANASHELRTPLATLRAELELALLHDDGPEELRRAVRAALEDTDRLVRLAEDLLVLARADAGRLPVRIVAVPVPELLDRVVRLVPADGRVVTVARPLPARVAADQGRLEQAMRNLLENAVAHGAGPIQIGARADPESATLWVHDDGPHLPAEARARAFERFATRDGQAGTGLGLAIVAAVAQVHGGTAGLENTEAGGVTATITILGSRGEPDEAGGTRDQ